MMYFVSIFRIILSFGTALGLVAGVFGQTAPTITTQPATQSVMPGGALSLSATASGSTPLTYQWYRNGSVIAGATNATYSVPSAGLIDGGRYHMAATNSAGTALSAPVGVRLSGVLWGSGNDFNGSLGTGPYYQKFTNLIPTGSGVKAVAAGFQHSLFLRTDGTLWVVGGNSSGQLGIGSTEQSWVPLQVASSVTAIAAGSNFSLYLKTDGTLWSMGDNQFGQLGDGTTVNRLSPVQVASSVASISAGSYFSFFIKTNGSLWAMGNNYDGQLGDGTKINRLSPVQVSTSIRSVAASAGGHYSLFVKTDNTLWATGANYSGQFGDGTTTSRAGQTQVASGVSMAAAGESHSLFVKTDGTLWAVGNNSCGQLGTGTTTNRLTWIQVASSVATVGAGPQHSLFVKTDGALWAMGYNDLGQLGDGSTSIVRASPVAITSQVSKVACGSSHSIIIKGDGTVWACGNAMSGALGNGSSPFRNSPVRISSSASSFEGRNSHGLLLASDGKLWAMGSNEFGQLGDGSTTNHPAPIQMASSVKTIAAGEGFSLFVKADGTLWSVGLNGNGQLGDGSTTNRSSPVQIASEVVDVSAGGSHSLFLKADGSLWAMGWNMFGQLGDGTNLARLSPVRIASSVVSSAAGNGHSLFLKADGTLWVMGSNNLGQLGDGSTTDRWSPIQVASSVATISAGANHSIFLKADGTLWTMGWNVFGQLGDGTTTDRSAPVKVASGVIAAAAGMGHTLFVKTDGTLWAIGSNQSGEFGNGTYTNCSSPVQIASGVVQLNARGESSTFVKAAGTGVGPAVTTPPASRVSTVGAPVTLSVTASGSDPLDYRWQKDGVDVPNARSKSLYLPYFQTSNAGAYSVIVTNGAGSVTSAAAIVAEPIAITAQPASMTVSAFNPTTLSVTATGAPLSYQWRKGGAVIAGATSSSYTITSTVTADAGTYDVVLSNGIDSVTSIAANLAVNKVSAIVSLGSLSQTFDGSPRAASATTTPAGLPLVWTYAGGSAVPIAAGSYAVTATISDANYVGSGSGTLVVAKAVPSISWTSPGAIIYGSALGAMQLNATAAFPGSFSYTPVAGTVLVPGQRDLSVTFTPADTVNLTTATASVAISVSPKPLGGTFLVSDKVYDGTVSAPVVARGLSGGIVGSDDVRLADGMGAFDTPSAASGKVVTLFGATLAGAQASYYVLTGVSSTTATIQPRALSVSGLTVAGRAYNGRGEIAIDGNPVLSGKLISDDVSLVGAAAGILNSPGAGSGKSVTVYGLSLTGTAVGNYYLQLPALTTGISKAPLIAKAEDKTKAQGDPNPVLTIAYSGFVNGEGAGVISEPSVNTPASIDSPAGSYPINLSGGIADNYSIALESGTLTVISTTPPAITSQPQSRLVAISGGSVNFSVAAVGSPPLSYQWYFNNNAKLGATSATLALNNLQASGAGNYWVVISNSLGSVKSAVATLEITQAGNAASHLVVGAGYVAGQTVTVSNILSYTGTASALSWSVLLPPGWSFASAAGSAGDQGPVAGTTDFAEWAWTAPPASPVNFAYTLNVPAGQTGTKELVSLVGVRNGSSLQFLARPDPLAVDQILTHSADTNSDFTLSLLELTRVIELYNVRNGTMRTGCYSVAATTSEDGFVADGVRSPAATVEMSRYHSADSNRDGRISLLELTRVIELYNYRSGTTRTGRYKPQSNTEDGFAPGP